LTPKRVAASIVLKRSPFSATKPSSPENFSPDTTVLFFNDAALRIEDIPELIH
jgi:alpha-1,3-mannosyltransferase